MALKDLLSYETTINVSIENKRDLELPSFTLCLFGNARKMFKSIDLANGKMGTDLKNLPFPVKIKSVMKYNSHRESVIDLLDESQVREHFKLDVFDDLWDLNCKPTWAGTCIPCLTFNNVPFLTTNWIDLTVSILYYLSFKHLKTKNLLIILPKVEISVTDIGNYTLYNRFVTQLHENGQSNILRKEFDLDSSIFFILEMNKTL